MLKQSQRNALAPTKLWIPQRIECAADSKLQGWLLKHDENAAQEWQAWLVEPAYERLETGRNKPLVWLPKLVAQGPGGVGLSESDDIGDTMYLLASDHRLYTRPSRNPIPCKKLFISRIHSFFWSCKINDQPMPVSSVKNWFSRYASQPNDALDGLLLTPQWRPVLSPHELHGPASRWARLRVRCLRRWLDRKVEMGLPKELAVAALSGVAQREKALLKQFLNSMSSVFLTEIQQITESRQNAELHEWLHGASSRIGQQRRIQAACGLGLTLELAISMGRNRIRLDARLKRFSAAVDTAQSPMPALQDGFLMPRWFWRRLASFDLPAEYSLSTDLGALPWREICDQGADHFPKDVQALDCAIELIRRLDRLNWSLDGHIPLPFRHRPALQKWLKGMLLEFGSWESALESFMNKAKLDIDVDQVVEMMAVIDDSYRNGGRRLDRNRTSPLLPIYTAWWDRAPMRLLELGRRWNLAVRRLVDVQLTEIQPSARFVGQRWPALISGAVNFGERCLLVLTEDRMLYQEGRSLQHCVGGWAPRCLYEGLHIISVREKPGGVPRSTLALSLKQVDGNWVPGVEQHLGMGNCPPDDQCVAAVRGFMNHLKNPEQQFELENVMNALAERLSSSDLNEEWKRDIRYRALLEVLSPQDKALIESTTLLAHQAGKKKSVQAKQVISEPTVINSIAV
jgi:hypothetical protein